MTVGKAIYYLLSNYSDLTDIVSTRIYPEVAEQDAAMPFVIYTVVSNEPSDTQSSPSQLDIAQVDVVLFSTDYAESVDMGVAARAALDRVTGTYNGVNVQSCQYTSEVIDFEEYPRAYVITQSYDVRINRDEFEIAQGTPVTGANIIDLADTPSTYGTTGQALVMNAEGDALEWGETNLAIRVKTQDGATDVPSVNEIRVTNGTLTDEGNGVVSINTGAISDTSITLDDGSNVSYSAVGPMQFYSLRIPAISDWTIVSGIVAVQIQFVLNPNTITLSNITTGYRLTGSLTFYADLDSAGTVLFELRGNNGSVVGSAALNGAPGVNTQGVEIDKLLISETEVITARMISFGPPVSRAYIESATLTITT